MLLPRADSSDPGQRVVARLTNRVQEGLQRTGEWLVSKAKAGRGQSYLARAAHISGATVGAVHAWPPPTAHGEAAFPGLGWCGPARPGSGRRGAEGRTPWVIWLAHRPAHQHRGKSATSGDGACYKGNCGRPGADETPGGWARYQDFLGGAGARQTWPSCSGVPRARSVRVPPLAPRPKETCPNCLRFLFGAQSSKPAKAKAHLLPRRRCSWLGPVHLAGPTPKTALGRDSGGHPLLARQAGVRLTFRCPGTCRPDVAGKASSPGPPAQPAGCVPGARRGESGQRACWTRGGHPRPREDASLGMARPGATIYRKDPRLRHRIPRRDDPPAPRAPRRREYDWSRTDRLFGTPDTRQAGGLG